MSDEIKYCQQDCDTVTLLIKEKSKHDRDYYSLKHLHKQYCAKSPISSFDEFWKNSEKQQNKDLRDMLNQDLKHMLSEKGYSL